MDIQRILKEIYSEVSEMPVNGKVADYIPQLGMVSSDKFGIHLVTTDYSHFSIGDSEEKFSIQSISKVFATALAFSELNDELWQRVGKEPSGTAFNSLIQLEYEKGIPRNPLINAGALVVADILIDQLKHPKEDFLAFVRLLAGSPDIHYDLQVATSEKLTGFRNISLANFIKSFGNIRNDVHQVLDFYFYMCAVSMTCRELAQSFLLFANHGIIPHTDLSVLTASQTKRLNALMQTCGFYDEAGEFTFRVGLPGKSGVGGGIVAILPQKYSVAVWSPLLNKKGNSIRGMHALELLTTKSGHSIF